MESSISRLLASNVAFTVGRAVKQGVASNEINAISATTDIPLGIMQGESFTAAETLASTRANGVVVQGVCQALAGAAIAAGDSLVVDADGDLVAKTVAGWVVGTALTPAANGEYFSVLVNIRKEPV